VEQSLVVAWLPEPEKHWFWPEIEEILAADHDEPRCDGDTVWLAIDDGVIVAVVTARLCEDGAAEIVNVSGKDWRRWVEPFEATLVDWARHNSMRRVRAFGRRGWMRAGKALGWRQTGPETYEKVL